MPLKLSAVILYYLDLFPDEPPILMCHGVILRFNNKIYKLSLVYATPANNLQHVMVCICLLERAYFNYLECSYNTWYV